MLSVNDIITDASGRSYRLVGLEQGTGRWIAQAVDFGSPFVIGPDALREEFGVADGDEDQPPAVDEQAGWEALAERERASHVARDEDDDVPLKTPEDVFDSRRLGPQGK